MMEDFNHTIDSWIAALEAYNFSQLCAKPSASSWSLGQVYVHLIEDSTYYIEQIKICLSSNENSLEEPSREAEILFLKNEFPDERIEGAAGNAYLPQPRSKSQLLNELIRLKIEMNNAAVQIAESPFYGKTKHPGLHYFSAEMWLQFAAMHLRHHLRQKQRLDLFLKGLRKSE